MTTKLMNNDRQQVTATRAGGLAVRTTIRAGSSRGEFMAHMQALLQQLANAQTGTAAPAADTPDTTATTTV